jgi:NDP-sugar pyrophosphorylase family protein
VKPQGLDISELHPLAFAGIHVVSPRIFEEMESMPAKFSIIDFYLQAMTEHRIMGYTPPQFAMLDVGKTDTLQPAEEFVKRYL